jgi:2,3-diketo-5-methylthio-1-phosphopentane phosphatase
MVDPDETFVALDFDHTIIDGNSDWVVQELGEIPQELRTAAPSEGFTQFMDNVFVHLRKNHGVSRQMLIDKVLTVPLAPGMDGLMKFLARPVTTRSNRDGTTMSAVEVFIVSDANTEFVRAALEKYQIDRLIPMKKVHTNHAYVDEDGGLRVKPYLPRVRV